MGTVYCAVDRYSGDPVALKLLHAEPGKIAETERFARESQLLAELRHPGIVAYVGHGQTPDGQRYLAMEWLEGHDLGERLSRGPLRVPDCVRLLVAVADALSVAHTRGIVHRDLKPSNLFLVGGDAGRVKILDFGIARHSVSGDVLTRTGMVVGTPEYMAPEQARGSRALSPSADLFSLGCVLYECLTGQSPFAADHIAAVLVRILFEEPRPIEEHRPGISPALLGLLNRLLAKRPEQRLAHAAALQSELLRLGDCPEPALASTMAMPAALADGEAEEEQSLLSVVLATSPEQDMVFGTTLRESRAQLAVTERTALLQGLSALGGTADFLANGALVVTVPPLASAQDQATVAARSALLIKDHWPDTHVAMATGRGLVRGRIVLGHVVELAAQLLKHGSDPSNQALAVGVRMDPMSARLLAGRFVQTPQTDGAQLLHEERDEDASRPLLGKPTPCVGRDGELGMMESLLHACIEDSQAQVLLVTGPPGRGKSRLRHEFLRRVEKFHEPVTMLIGRGDWISAGAPYAIVADAIWRLCGISRRDSLAVQRQQLQTRIALRIATGDIDQTVPFIGELCGIHFPDAGNPMLQAARRDPKLMHDCVHAAFLRFLVAECAAAPVLVVLDDLQWADAMTVALLDEALQDLAEARLFVLALARPEVSVLFPKLWQLRRRQELPLPVLSKKACQRLIQQVLGTSIPSDVLAKAIEQSAGNALFLEEIIRSVAGGRSEERPETILAMLQARIGRLDAGPRRLLRAGAIFGQTFWQGGVAVILGVPPDSSELRMWLSALVDAELIQAHPTSRLPQDTECSFRHSLVRDAAYGLLSESALHIGHRQAAEFLETAGFDDLPVIAEHYYLAKAPARALPLFVRSAQQAYELYALEDMQRRAERGLACGAEGDQLGILQELQFHAVVAVSDWPRAQVLGMDALQHLAAGSLPWCRLIGLLGSILCFTGQADRAVSMAHDFVELQPAAEAQSTYLYSAMYFVVLFSQGGLRAAANRVLARMEGLATSLDGSDVLMHAPLAFSRATYLRSFQPDPSLQIHAAKEAAAAYQQMGNVREACVCGTFVGAMLTDAGDLSAAEATLRRILSVTVSRKLPNLTTSSYLHLADVLAKREEPAALQEARELLGKATATPGLSSGFRGWAHGILAQIRFAEGSDEAAEAEARMALALSESAPLRRLLALTSLVRVLLRMRRFSEAHQLAETGLHQAEALGGGGYSELPVRLVVAEARSAAGDPQGALAILQAANAELQRRASLIPDLVMRATYLNQVPEHARISQLLQAWSRAEDGGIP